MRKYVVWSYNYRPDSAGQKTMHLLCHELNRAGQDAAVCFPARNPAWDTPYRSGPVTDDSIAVYPELVRGNPLRARHVVRWMLNRPFGTYAPPGMRFSFSRLFDPAPLLFLPSIEVDLYQDQHLDRTLMTYWVGKEERRRDLPGAIPVARGSGPPLADILNRARVMYTFDGISGMNEIARLCGCPVVFVPGGRLTRAEFDEHTSGPGYGWDEMPEPDPVWAHRRQAELRAAFPDQLATFIEATQA